MAENQITVYDLYQATNERRRRQHECFVIILERCYNRIRKCASVSRSDCLFEVPEFILGKPLYNIDRCVRYVLTNLEGNGYRVTYVFPRFLHISWDLQKDDTGEAFTAAHAHAHAHAQSQAQAQSATIGPPAYGEGLLPPPAMTRTVPPGIAGTDVGHAAPSSGPRAAARTATMFRSIAEFKPSGKFVLRV